MTRKILIPHTASNDSIVSGDIDTASTFNSIHSIGVYTSEFIGSIHIQGTLVNIPSESDWATILTIASDTQSSTSEIFNIIGSFARIRVKVENFTTGIIRQVVYNS